MTAKADSAMRPDEDSVSLWERPGFLVRRLHQISVAIFLDEMKCLEITPVQFGALSIIAANPGIDQSALGAQLGIDRANVADVVLRLVSSDYVERKASTTDRRVKTIFITSRGARVLSESLDRLKDVQSRLLQPLAPPERDQFMVLLVRLIEENNSLGRAPLILNPGKEGAAARP